MKTGCQRKAGKEPVAEDLVHVEEDTEPRDGPTVLREDVSENRSAFDLVVAVVRWPMSEFD